MLRWLMGAAALLVLLAGGLPALAHTMNLTAELLLEDSRMAVRLVDPYGASVGGGTVSAEVRLQGTREAIPLALTEEAPGSYSADLPAMDAGQRFDLRINVLLGTDLYRLDLQGLQAGRGESLHRWPVKQVESSSFPWGAFLYGAALVLMGAATTLALVRRRSMAEGQGGPA